ncbi:hypothetical protein ACHAPC_009811 [Botrytis cinerea]
MPSSASTSSSAGLSVLGGLFLLFSSVAGSNLTYYSPQPGVDPAFANWINEFYTAAEATNTTAYGYSEFFSSNATINLGGWNPAQDVTDGLTVRIHYPVNVTATKDTTDTVFDLFGLTKGHYENGTCRVDSYETRFTIQDVDCRANLKPRSGSLTALNLIEQTASSQSCDTF